MKSFLKNALLLIACFCVTYSAAQVPANTTLVQGSTAGGAAYEFAVPTAWNGALVVYLHGIVDPALEPMLPSADTESDFLTVRNMLLGEGFAVASSSWKSTGYSVKDAAQNTHQLRGLFIARFGIPKKVLIAGKSLGALAAARLIEQYPAQYNGALLTCGPLGGSRAEVQYLGDERVLFDRFFPGVMPGDVNNTPLTSFDPREYPDGLYYRVLYALMTGGDNTAMFAIYSNLQIPPLTGDPQIDGGYIAYAAMNGMGFSARHTADLKARTQGHDPYGNADRVYSSFGLIPNSDNVDLYINSTVTRYTAAPDATEYLDHNYTPSGNLQVPVLTLHTRFDPVIPMFHEKLYAEAAAHADASQFLVQRSVTRFGHCAFDPREIVGSFNDLYKWVNSSSRPQGGDVTIQ